MTLLASTARRRVAPPLTGYEAHGGLTTEAEETALWEQAADETGLTVEITGLSTQGRPIRTVSVGAGDANSLLIVCCRHGYEKAPREGALAFIRNLAYATDSTTLDYLANHRVALVPVLNPDSFAEGIEGPKGLSGGVDLNSGDNWRMYAQESRVFAQIWANVQPTVHVDAHSFGSGPVASPSGETFGAWPGLAPQSAHEDIAALITTNGPADVMLAACAGAGYTTNAYTNERTPGDAGADGAVNHAVSLTTETHSGYPRSVQYGSFLTALEALRDWHAENGAAASAARDASMTAPSAPGFVPTYNSISDGWQTIPGLAGYTIPSALPAWQKLLFGIDDPVGNFVTIEQPAGHALPQLLDPDSPLRLYSGAAVRVMS